MTSAMTSYNIYAGTLLRAWHCLLLCIVALLPATAVAQRQHRLTDAELKIDSLLPVFTFMQQLGDNYADSAYSVGMEYPEWEPMKRSERRRYRKLAGTVPPDSVSIDSYVGTSRRQGTLYAAITPFATIDGKAMKLRSFQPVVTACAKTGGNVMRSRKPATATTTRHQLSSGRWVKISIPATGIYELSDSLLMAAGFSEPQNVRIFGFGGAPQPEALTRTYIEATDTLPQVPVCNVGGRRLFYGVGPVNWETPQATARTRNPYSDIGCYFLTDDASYPQFSADSAQFASGFYPSANDYHALYEVDDYAWYWGGQNLYDKHLYAMGRANTYRLPTNGRSSANISITMSYNGYCSATVHVNGTQVGSIVVDAKTTNSGTDKKQYLDSYMKAAADVWTFSVGNLPADSVDIVIRKTFGADMRLDNIDMRFAEPASMPALSTAAFAAPSIIGSVAPQNRHADDAADMVIIIPTSASFEAQAERLADMHRSLDGMRVNVVRADQLYNEFSSGTPDINAYRRYLKMLYDRAATEDDMPRYLLLFGDAAYDNRLHTNDFSQLRADDLLLCYESDNSMSATACYVSDDFIGMLDDGEGADIIKTDKCDVAIGRLPARTAEEATVLVDKIYSYRQNKNAGAWQNVICLMGDDGNANMHMNDAEAVASLIASQHPHYDIKKIHWDAYERTTDDRGNYYPDVTRLILRQMYDGALLMNYSGHGGPTVLSHENAVLLSDYKAPAAGRLPLWFTASCEVAPFDGYTENIGEQAMLNKSGGAIAFIGTTRTVYALHNRSMNLAFTKHLLQYSDARGCIGEALRQAKNDQVLGPQKTQRQAGINKLHFVLLGDPALRLPLPTDSIIIDSINGIPVADTLIRLTAGDTVSVAGHITSLNSQLSTLNSQLSTLNSFNGTATLTVKDALVTVTCRKNPLPSEETPKQPLVYTDRPSTLFAGQDSVVDGRFRFTFALPKDISYSDDTGLMLVHAVSSDRSTVAHGGSEAFTMVSADDYATTGDGPHIMAWLDTPAFSDGSHTSDAPLLHADFFDEDGINTSDAALGHGIELRIDNSARLTYDLTPYFRYTFGDYRSGTVDFQLPTLEEGHHSIELRAWDVLNNSTLLTLNFTTGPIPDLSGISDNNRETITNNHYYDLLGRHLAPLNSQLSPLNSHLSPLLIVRHADGSTTKKHGGRRQ